MHKLSSSDCTYCCNIGPYSAIYRECLARFSSGRRDHLEVFGGGDPPAPLLTGSRWFTNRLKCSNKAWSRHDDSTGWTPAAVASEEVSQSLGTPPPSRPQTAPRQDLQKWFESNIISYRQLHHRQLHPCFSPCFDQILGLAFPPTLALRKTGL